MTRIRVMTTLSLSEIKARLSEVIDQVEHQHDRVVLTRNGVPAAVIMSPADLQALEDTLDLLSDPSARSAVEVARREIAVGESFTAEELRLKYLTT
jgi:prevent-host-death family protein